MLSEERYQNFLEIKEQVEKELARLKTIRLKPTDVADYLEEKGEPQLKDGILVYDFIRRPYVKYADIIQFAPSEVTLSKEVTEQVENLYQV